MQVRADQRGVGRRASESVVREGPNLRCKRKLPGSTTQIQWLDTEGIPRQHELSATSIEHGKRKHSVDRAKEPVDTKSSITVNQRLRVARPTKRVPFREESRAKVQMVVKLAVEDHGDRAVV